MNGIPATLSEPQSIRLDNIASTIIADGFYEASELCTAAYADACGKAGIS